MQLNRRPQLMLNELLFSGGVQLTINGSNLDLVERPQMTVSVNFSTNGIRTSNYSVMVRWSHLDIIQWAYIKKLLTASPTLPYDI